MPPENFKTTDLCDESPEKLAICEPIFHSFGKRRRFSGRISTVKVHEDNVLVGNALEYLPPGAVLVVDGGGSKKCALLGDKLARIAVERNLGGIVINGCVRDSAELAEMDIGILALAAHPRRSEKKGEGEANVPVVFGGVVWAPGHYLYADEDGIVVSSDDLSEERP
ncbi:MAG: ribonuclease E activity regulator RraA [Actinomycetota bacterium]|jgi:regulator of ribonuclease activity A|nr:ribonuclease E activity regulator RraA [Rubrobacter sp.]MDQ3506763.1 ribonuclease E activity regulator RraA [Actinomycetota bacterium]